MSNRTVSLHIKQHFSLACSDRLIYNAFDSGTRLLACWHLFLYSSHLRPLHQSMVLKQRLFNASQKRNQVNYFFLYMEWGHPSQVCLALYKGSYEANLNSLSKLKLCLMGKVWFHKQICARLMLCRQNPIMINMWHLGPIHSAMCLHRSENCLPVRSLRAI